MVPPRPPPPVPIFYSLCRSVRAWLLSFLTSHRKERTERAAIIYLVSLSRDATVVSSVRWFFSGVASARAATIFESESFRSRPPTTTYTPTPTHSSFPRLLIFRVFLLHSFLRLKRTNKEPRAGRGLANPHHHLGRIESCAHGFTLISHRILLMCVTSSISRLTHPLQTDVSTSVVSLSAVLYTLFSTHLRFNRCASVSLSCSSDPALS